MKIKYMHTLGQHPESFTGEQITYTVVTRPIELCDSLAEIKKQRRLSLRWRKKQGFFPMLANYGHRRVRVG